MRIYKNFTEALNEIKRDLAEMGIKVHPQTMQNKDVANNPDFETLELQNYVYTVMDTDVANLKPTQPWAAQEFMERISGNMVNPGTAWMQRPEVWKEFLNDGVYGCFSYTYAERINNGVNQIQSIVNELKIHPDSRQLYLSIWDPYIDMRKLGKHRVPCSLGYLFQLRGGKLNVTYIMRSSDFATHFHNDLYLAVSLRNHIAGLAGVEIGTFTHFIGSFHIYKKDVEGVF
jgi:thymidylate synthase